MAYDGSRKLNTVTRTVVEDPTTPDKRKYQYNPVPYNIEFKVYVYANHSEDASKIVEQILPYFTPDWTTTVQLVPEVVFKPTDLTHQSILQALETSLPQTIVALTPSALLKAEGVILRNTDRTKIVKLRFEDYIRTLKSSK